MRWKDIKLRNKLFLGFGIVLLLLVTIVIITYRGVTSVANNAGLVIQGNQIDGLLAQKEVDHLNWINKVNALWTDPQTTRINVQTNDHKCGFGKWLYGQGRKDLEKTYPEIAALLKKIESPHNHLHDSVVDINKIMDAHTDKAAGRVAAGLVLREKTIPALTQVQDQLNGIRQLARDMIMTDEVMIKKAQTTRHNTLIISIISILAAVALAAWIARSISQPTVHATAFVEKLAQGNFTEKLDIHQKDEIGILANALNRLVTDLGKMFREVINGVSTMKNSTMDLNTISEQMNVGAEQTSGQANTVAAAAEEMSTNMSTVAAASEQASTNVNMVATATEEMSATIGEIAKNSEKARDITTESVSQSQNASSKVDELGVAATDITKVTEVITEISEQTNLLALRGREKINTDSTKAKLYNSNSEEYRVF